MKKHSRIFTLSAALLCGLLTACNGGGSSIPSDPSVGPQPGPSSSSESSSSDNWEAKSKRAMENFKEKVSKPQYNIASDGLTTNVVSNNLVYFDYPDGSESHDFAAMSVGNETFQSRLDMGEIKGVMFVDKGLAIKVAEQNLPSYWFNEEELGKDIWDMFEMTQPNDNKLHYLVKDNDPTIQMSLGAFLGIGKMYIHGISAISMEFDKEDVTQATLKAKFSDGTSPTPKDVSATINIGTATTHPLAEQWLNNSDRMMPSPLGPVGYWSGNPLMVIDSMLMLSNSTEAGAYVPFADFMSYAIWTNLGAASSETGAIIRDYHGTIKDVEAYKEKLIQQNFTLKKTPAGEPYYTKLLRAKGDYGVYARVEVEYDHGFVLNVNREYEVYKFNTRNALNELIDGKGFATFPETEDVHGWFGEDEYLLQTENWAYFYNFTLYPRVQLRYTDQNKAVEYLEKYGKSLEDLGFKKGQTSSTLTTWEYIDKDVGLIFKYTLDIMGNLSFLLSREEYADSAVMKSIMEAAGFPTIDITAGEFVTTQDHKKFERYYQSTLCDAAYRNTFYFEENDDAKKFLADYEKALRDAGFQKKDAYYVKDNLVFQWNEAAGGMVGLYFFVLTPQQ